MNIILRYLTWTLILLCGIRHSTLAQSIFENPTVHMKKLGIGHISAITTDAEGFMWFGTPHNGLYRYDGLNLKKYYQENITQENISFVGIRSLSYDHQRNIIWVVTDKFLFEFDPVKGTFNLSKIYANNPNLLSETPHCITPDKHGNHWLAIDENKLFQITNTGETIIHKYQINSDAESFSAQKLIINNQRKGSIFLIGKGLAEYSVNTGKINKIASIPQTFDFLHHTFIRSVHQTENGLLLLGCWSKGLFVFDPNQKTIDHYNKAKNNDGRHTIRSIYPFKEEQYFITSGYGLHLLDLKTKQITDLKKNFQRDNEEYGVSHITSTGMIFNRGINESFQYAPIENQFKHFLKPENDYQYTTLCNGLVEDEHYIYSVYYGGSGIYRFNKAINRWHTISIPNQLKTAPGKYMDVRSIIQHNDKNIIGLHVNHIFNVEIPNGPVSILPISTTLPTPLYNSMAKDMDGAYWLGTRTVKLIRLSPDLKTTQTFSEELHATPLKSKNIWIDWLKIDSKGQLWLRNNQGYSVVTKEQPINIEHIHYDQESEKKFYSITGALEDAEKNMWIFGEAIGKVSIDRPDEKIGNIISPPTASYYSFTHGIIIDTNTLALSNNEMHFLNTHTNKIRPYPSFYGYHNIRLNGPWIKLKDGQIAVGHEKGFSTFHPNKLLSNTELPKAYLYSVRANNRDVILESKLSKKNNITLPKGTNFINLKFGSLAYNLPEQITYQYQLANSGWINAGSKTEINLSQLQAGKHHFALRATNNEELVSQNPYLLTINIAKYWYETLIFKSIFGLLMISCLFGLYNWRKKNHAEKSHWKLQKTALELKALRAQMNPHFIYNCLNAIDTLILQEDVEKASSYLQIFAKLIRILLEQSRREKVSISDDIEALQLYVEMENLRFDQKINFNVTVDPNISQEVTFIPPLLVQPFVENAIRHGISSKTRGIIELTYEKIGHMIEIKISDDGIGRQQSAHSSNNNKIKLGTRITEERLQLIKQQFNQDLHVEIKDLYQKGMASGTTIILQTPSLSYE